MSLIRPVAREGVLGYETETPQGSRLFSTVEYGGTLKALEAAKKAAQEMVRMESIAQPWTNPTNPPQPERHRVIFSRPYDAIGDLVFILGGIQGYHERFPERELHFHAHPVTGRLAENHPALSQIHYHKETLPTDAEVINLSAPCPALMWEQTQPRPYLDRITLYARAMGIDNPELPRIYLSEEERSEARQWLHDQGIPSARPILVSWRTRSHYKDYPHVGQLIQLLRHDHDVVAIDRSGDWYPPHTLGLSIRQIAALIDCAELVICGDTGWMHVAGALKRPLFGLFGSQNPVTRQAIWNVPGAWISGPCPHGKQPCWEKTCRRRTEYLPCLDIPVEAVHASVKATLQSLRQAHLPYECQHSEPKQR